MGENFKVRCIDLCGQNLDTYKLGKVYEVVNGKLISEGGYPIGGVFNSVDDVNKFSASKFEAVTEKQHIGEYISVKRCKKNKRVVAVMSMDGVYQKSANVKLKDFDGDFDKAAKAAVDKLLGMFAVKEIEVVPSNPSYRIVKQDKYEVGDKVKVREDLDTIEDFENLHILPEMKRQAGKVIEIKHADWVDSVKDMRYRGGSSLWHSWSNDCFEGKVIEDTVKEKAPLTADGFKVGDRVELITKHSGADKSEKGTILYIFDDGDVTVEFDNNVSGHDGSYADGIKGKPGHCYHCKPSELKLVETAVKETPSFDWESFKSGKFAVHCDTEEKAREFLKECDEQGIKWGRNQLASSHTYWEAYKEKTIYNHSFGLGYCDINGPAHKSFRWEILDYTSSKPTAKEVSRQGKVGEYIKITNARLPEGVYQNGDIRKVAELPRDGAGTCGVKIDNGKGGTKCVCNSEYVVLEGYVPEDKPTVKEVKRPAKVGEWIKVTYSNSGMLTNVIGRVIGLEGDMPRINHRGIWCSKYPDGTEDTTLSAMSQYVVLENYQPDNTPIDSNPELEQAIASVSMREVKRGAKPGDIIKIVNSDGNSENEYQNGDVLRVVKVDKNIVPKSESNIAFYQNKSWKYASYDEYVVLENFDYSVFPKNEPWRKAKVGDKIKVVKVATKHGPEIKVGDIQTVTNVVKDAVWTKPNYFADRDQEYIIIEEAPEVKPISQSTISEVARYSTPQRKPEDTIPCFWDGRRFRDYEKGDMVKVINRKPYENGYGLKNYGTVYQPMHDTVVVMFGSVGINMLRSDIEYMGR